MSANPPFRIDPSQTAAFKALNMVDIADEFDDGVLSGIKAVVIGGGTGAPVSIRSLLSLGIDTQAIVAMADDGGSTGILRESANVSPPGDVRKCIAAFAQDADDPLAKAFKYRIAIANDHALGNLLLAALEDASGSFTKAIEVCEHLLKARGHVIPSTLDHVKLRAVTRDGQVLDGQAVACHSQTALKKAALIGEQEADVHANPEAVDAILDADLIILGPGSLFTSIIPNLLVPGILDAIERSHAATLFVCSVADTQGETWGLSAKEHVRSLLEHGMDGMLDYVLVHSKNPLQAQSPATSSFIAATGEEAVFESMPIDDNGSKVRPVFIDYIDAVEIQAMGPVVIARNLIDDKHPTWHAPAALRQAIMQVIKLSQSRY